MYVWLQLDATSHERDNGILVDNVKTNEREWKQLIPKVHPHREAGININVLL